MTNTPLSNETVPNKKTHHTDWVAYLPGIAVFLGIITAFWPLMVRLVGYLVRR